MKLLTTAATIAATLALAAPASALPAFTVTSTVRPDTSVSFLATFDGGPAFFSRSYSWHEGDVRLAGGTAYRSWVAPAGLFTVGCHTVEGRITYRLGLRGTGSQSATTTFCIA